MLDVVGMCGSLVTIRARSVHFVHLSARSYILSEECPIALDPLHQHSMVAERCFEYLFEAPTTSGTVAELVPSTAKENNLLGYPVIYWTEHASLCPGAFSKKLDKDTAFLQARSTCREKWFDTHWHMTCQDWDTKPSTLTALHGLRVQRAQRAS